MTFNDAYLDCDAPGFGCEGIITVRAVPGSYSYDRRQPERRQLHFRGRPLRRRGRHHIQ